MASAQERLDAFYFSNGKCCAGCDNWRHMNSIVGECLKSAPVSGAERLSMIGISWTSSPVGCGHAITKKNHCCGDFKDEFEWTSLPLPYLKRVGFYNKKTRQSS